MNTVERRVSEGLRAYGERLTMTAEDVDRLEDQLDFTVPAPRTKRGAKSWLGAVAACAVTGMVFSALALREDPEARTQPASPPPVTLEQLQGIWRVTDSDWLWRFDADGTVTQSNAPNLLSGVGTARAYTVRPNPGGFIAENAPGDPPGCYEVWAVSISAEGRMRATEAGHSAACADAVPGGEVWELTRVSPVSVAGAATKSGRPSSEPEPVTDPASLTGTWLLQGTGTLLTIDGSASYALQDLGATGDPETGNVAVRPDGTVSFASDDVPACTAVYDSMTSTGTVLDAEVRAGSCDRLAATSDTWLRLN
jgi:hypothetical protein